MAGHGSSIRAILYALFANLGIAIAKGIAAIYTGSGSMMAESIHSLADCSNQGLLFLGLKRSNRPPDKEHPLGYGKAIYVWSFIVAILLFSMGGLFSAYEGFHKLNHPEPLNQVWIALVVLGFSIVLEFFSLFGAIREINHIKGQKTLREWLRTARTAELVVVFYEDIAALLGLIIAFVFVFLSWLTLNPLFDALGSITIGVILIIISLFLVVKVKAMLIGRSADPELEEHIRKMIAQDGNIKEVFKIITLQNGPQILLAAKIRMKPGLSLDDGARAINKLEESIKGRFPEIMWCFVEPDVSD